MKIAKHQNTIKYLTQKHLFTYIFIHTNKRSEVFTKILLSQISNIYNYYIYNIK